MNYRIDLFSIFIFLGIVQGIFLLVFFLSKENRKNEVNLFHALFLFSIIACIFEIFLMYTGYIVNVLYLVDFSEALSFVIGPSFYLLMVNLIRGPMPSKYYWHFAFPVLYFLIHLPFLILPDDFKYNAYVDSYRPDLPFRDVQYPYNPYMFVVTNYHSEITLISLCFYALLGSMEVVKAFRKKKESFWNPKHPVLRTLRMGTIQMVSAFLIILLVKLFNENDYGDHLLAAYIAITVYFTSFSVIKNSGFFKQASLDDQPKYKTSSVTADQQQVLLVKLRECMMKEKPFLRSDFSMPDLAGSRKHLLVTMLASLIPFYICYFHFRGHIQLPFSLDAIETTFDVTSIFVSWFTVITIIAYGQHYLNKPHPWLTKISEGLYPFYILHQTVIIVIGYYICQLDWSITAKYWTISFLTLISCTAFYMLLIRPFNVMRFLFGMKAKSKKIFL